MTKIVMINAVAYRSPFVAGRDEPLAIRTLNIFNLTDQEWLRDILQASPDNFITLTPTAL